MAYQPTITAECIYHIIDHISNPLIKINPFELLVERVYKIHYDAEVIGGTLTSQDEKNVEKLIYFHLTQPCCLKERSAQCFLHYHAALYCLARHVDNHTSSDDCIFCTTYLSAEKRRKQEESFGNSATLSLFSRHFRSCKGCWKCFPYVSQHFIQNTSISKPLQQTNMLSQQYNVYNRYSSIPPMTSPTGSTGKSHSNDPKDDQRSAALSQFVTIPRGVFYSEEGAKDDTHTGYLRIIPVSFENTVEECEDYKDLVKQMRGISSYQQRRKYEMAAIAESEKRIRHTIEETDIADLLIKQKASRNVVVTSAVLERISLALKEYLTFVLKCCKIEHQNSAIYTTDNNHDYIADVVDVCDVECALRSNKYMITSNFNR